MNFANALAEGDQFYRAGRAIEARVAWTNACAVAVSPTEILTIANRCLSLGFLSEAEMALGRLPADNASAAALSTRAALALERGDVATARQFLEDGGQRQHERLMSNALLLRHYEKPINAAGLLQASRLWASKIHGQLKAQPTIHHAARGARLRIGFVSGDLCAHPVGFLIAPLLRAFQMRADEVDIFVFDNGSHADWMTAQLKTYCPPSHWHTINMLSDAEASVLIASLQLDCLIDCAGHTSRSRLALFAQRLAHIQIAWGGYFSTTGLETIDAVVMDDFHLAAGIEEYFTENIIRVPSRFIYAPLAVCPPVTDMPFFRCGTITFGSFNNVAKINMDVISVWAEILREVDGSRLILKWRSFADANFCEYMKSCFSAFGILPERLTLRPFSIYRDTLAEYRDIDIALDPFPFTGGQTSLDALWMGVPLVTLAGFTPVERQGHAFVNLIGRADWSVTDPRAYVKKAVALACDPNRLREMRFDQRSLIHQSKLSDAGAFVDILMSYMRHHRRKLGSFGDMT